MDMEIVIYGIIGALAILVCWLLDIYSSTTEKETISTYSTDCLRSEKSMVILPTCCFCHKIRDEKGNWHERSEYQEDYQDVLFTHAFCHECALKHYGEFYQGTELELRANY
ncbi:hypothetical protein [Desulfobacca acetoxidans]